MAFPVPSHLPRKEKPVDISTRILTALGESTRKTLDVPTVSGWVAELEDSIQQTKTRIHDRIHEDRPAFDRQLAASRSVQDRLRSLSSNVQELDDALSNPQTGLVPALVSALTKHAALAQQASDARVAQKALAHLTQCRFAHRVLCAHVAAGELAQAVERCAALEGLLGEAPAALQKSEVFVDLKRQFRVVKDRTEEQLNDAYARAIVLTPSEMTIRSSVPVPSTQATISLPAIISSLSPASLSSHLAALRRTVIAHWIEHPLSQPLSISTFSSPEAHTLVATPAPPNDEHLPQRLENLRTILSFLSEHLFSALPPSTSPSSAPSTQQTLPFPRTLAQPLTSALLARLLTPSLPSTLSALPPFLELAHSAAAFENDAVEGLLGGTSDGDVRRWVDGVAGHYERKRRVEILGRARSLVLSKADVGEAFRVEVVVQVSGSTGRDVVITTSTPDPTKGDEEDAWGLDAPPPEKKETADDGDGWGFDEEEQVPASEPKPASAPVPSANGHASHQEQNQNHEEDTDAWGWDDDVPTDEPLPLDQSEPESLPSTNGTHDAASESDVSSSTTAADDDSTAETDTAWDDDPWADPPDEASAAAPTPAAPPPPPPPPPEPIHSPNPAQPKRMTRLEKLAMKGKAGSMSSASPSTSPAASPAPPPVPSPPPAQKSPIPAPAKHQPAPLQKPHRPEPLLRAEKESYAVSGRAKALLALAEEALSEADALVASNMFPAGPGTGTGTVLRGVAPAVLDLFRALVPLSAVKGDAADGVMHAGRTMRIANDCIWIAGESYAYGRRRDRHAEGERMEESGRKVDDLGKWWFDQCIERQLDATEETLAGTQRFADLADQDRFDQSEAAIMRVLRDVRSVGQQWKTTLTKSRYHIAIGALVEGVLVRVIEDVLELDDIPEVESHRLSELCKVLNALEGLFVDNPEQPSLVVAFVPSWLKYSYLSELLEASIADITYLFENGALVDFKVEELVKLVRALFADTPLRTTTINKIHSGHPVQA